MRALFTGDWQTRVSNLEECRELSKSLLRIVDEKELTTVVFLGDLKDAYNPLDLRVLEFWRNFIRDMNERVNVDPVFLLGNHDRGSLTNDDLTWFPALKDAGAEVFEEPGYTERNGDDGARIHMLPYSSDYEAFQKAVKYLKELEPNPSKDVLAFHETFTGGSYNQISKIEEGFRLSDLNPDMYRYVLGGDIHKHQRLRKNA